MTPRNLFHFISILVAISCCNAQTNIPAGFVSGEWNSAGSPYLIQGEITIHADSTLIIGPGVEINFQGWYKFNVEGIIEANGAEGDSIFFTADNTSEGWHALRFFDAPDSSQLSYCIFEYGRAIGQHTGDPDGWAGAIFCDTSHPYISHSAFRSNYSSHFAGAIGIYWNSNPVIEYCDFIENTALNGTGGAIEVWEESSPIISHCNFINNSSLRCAGIKLSADGSPLVSHCVFTDNSGGHGVLTFIFIYDARAEYCVLTGNEGTYGAGGITVWGSDVNISNCTIIANSSNSHGGIECIDGGNPVLVNNIIWDNSPRQITFNATQRLNTITIAYCDVEGGEAAIETNNNGTLNWEEGNRDAEPCFVDPPTGDYNLMENSPCVDAGTAFYEWGGTTILDLNPDQYEGYAPDMGALESPFAIHVSDDPVSSPAGFALLRAYPNPFNSSTTICYTIPAPGNVQLSVFDMNGRLVGDLVNGYRITRIHEVTFDASGLTSGVYFAKLTYAGQSDIQKLMLLK